MASSTSSPYSVLLRESDPSTPYSIRRIGLPVSSLKQIKANTGDILVLVKSNVETTHSVLDTYAVGEAWPSSELEVECVSLDSSLAQAASFGEGDRIKILSLKEAHQYFRITPFHDQIPTAIAMEVRYVEDPSPVSGSLKSVPKLGSRDWLVLAARERLIELKYVTCHQVVEIHYEGRFHKLVVAQIHGTRSHEPSLEKPLEEKLASLVLQENPKQKVLCHKMTWGTQLVMAEAQISNESKSQKTPSSSYLMAEISEPYANVGGLDAQVAQVRDLIEIPLTRPDLLRDFGLKPPRGILLYGPPGTGKTHLAGSIARSSHAKLLTISGPELSSAFHGETESKLREIFQDAKQKSPCIIVIDEVDALCPKREDTGGGVEGRVVATLLTLMDGMDAQAEGKEDLVPPRVVVVATTNRPNAIDPALRRPGRFDREIEIGIPDAPARFSILQVLLAKTPHSLTIPELDSIAKATHGYVGADLSAVVREAGVRAIKRNMTGTSLKGVDDRVLYEDLLFGATQIQPSALREHLIETPTVKWTDIGGQSEVKQKLKECVEWPLKYPDTFKRLGVVPPKGVLLYGPPGCSKTLTAKALATESAINFIAVKGPELLNKYVGESERAIRDIFRKARAAAPSIIFFDEIDALGASRGTSEGGNHEGVLTSLLNEMDGIQELIGVTIVAATNRPDVIDSALMRPGRLDRILYVGPPDFDARLEILRIKTSKMAVEPTLDLTTLASMTEGCSGAEIASLCQTAALSTMQKDIEALYVLNSDFVQAAKEVRKQITKEMIQHYEEWRDISGLSSA